MPDLSGLKSSLKKALGLTAASTEAVGTNDTQTLTNKTLDHLTKSKNSSASSATQFDIYPSISTVEDTSTRSTLRLWNNDDGTNNEYLDLKSEGTNGFILAVNKNGTGTVRNFIIRSGALDSVKYFQEFDQWVHNSVEQFIHGKLYIRDSNAVFSYIFQSSALGATRNVTLPLLTGNDTFVFEAHTQTLTNKTLTSPVISTISNTGTITLPTSTDTLVGKATTDTLTNKTLDARGTGNKFPNTAINPRVGRWGSFQAAGGTTAAAVGSVTGMLGSHTPTGAGTNTVTFDTTEGVIANFVSTATGNLNIGLVAPTGGPACRRLFATKMSARVKIDSTTSARMYVGFAGAALATSDTPIASGVAGVIVGFVSGATNFEIYHNDETGAMSTTTITGPIAKNNSWHTIEIAWTASGNVDVTFDGTTQTLSSNIPLTTSDLRFNCVGQTTTTTARTFSIHDVWIETEK